MKKIRNYKTLAFGLAVLLFMLQITSSAAIWQTEKAKAATGPQDTSTIVVSGAAVTVDPNIVMSAVTAVEITKYSIAYQWSAVPNANCLTPATFTPALASTVDKGTPRPVMV